MGHKMDDLEKDIAQLMTQAGVDDLRRWSTSAISPDDAHGWKTDVMMKMLRLHTDVSQAFTCY